MKKSLICLLVLAIATVGAVDVAAGGKKDQKALQGTWIPDEESEVAAMIFKGNKVTVKFGDSSKNAEFQCTYKLNTKADPNQIDIKVVKGPKEGFVGKVSLGVYKLENGKLTWCAAEPGRTTRPSKFARRIGDDNFLLVTFSKKK